MESVLGSAVEMPSSAVLLERLRVIHKLSGELLNNPSALDQIFQVMHGIHGCENVPKDTIDEQMRNATKISSTIKNEESPSVGTPLDSGPPDSISVSSGTRSDNVSMLCNLVAAGVDVFEMLEPCVSQAPQEQPTEGQKSAVDASSEVAIVPVTPVPEGALAVANTPAMNPPLIQASTMPTKAVLPSGPRRRGEGMSDIVQDILSVERIGDYCTVLSVTLLVSGFIIGPGGVSIRSIQRRTGTNITSWTQPLGSNQKKTVRMFSVQGTEVAQALALTLMKNAVCRYKYLSEGSCCGREVPQIQMVNGIEFFYSPPPKSVVPQAASVKEEWYGDPVFATELKTFNSIGFFSKNVRKLKQFVFEPGG
ncbi:hypothetical protein BSKO_06638 [Bryopsis sp. KO-2023]|nr:hypothetical protein BSKO_06638 [Bryopsis sp. KO-2023]